MKYLIFLLLISSIGYTQEIKDILKTRQFVLEATKTTDEEGQENTTSRKLCFILIDSSSIVIQWIADCDNNGLGGITMHGIIANYELIKNKIKKETQHIVNLKCDLDQGRVNSEIVIEIYNRSHADATLKNYSSSIFVPKQMKFLGKVVPLQSSKVMIGSH